MPTASEYQKEKETKGNGKLLLGGLYLLGIQAIGVISSYNFKAIVATEGFLNLMHIWQILQDEAQSAVKYWLSITAEIRSTIVLELDIASRPIYFGIVTEAGRVALGGCASPFECIVFTDSLAVTNSIQQTAEPSWASF